jgi:glucose-6-phosphate dehydrogenase assembly protein OpcA
VPQRTIVIQADPRGDDGMSSWISANCHLIGGGRQVCSEEVSIAASGDRVDHVPPLVSALLLPDMPVAVWWIGDLPRELRYAELLLDPADRLIFDSAHFDGREDLDFVARIAENTTTAPADLNWARIEEWRAATAGLFDPARCASG